MKLVKSAVQIVSAACYGLLATDPKYDFDPSMNLNLKNVKKSECLCSKGCGIVPDVKPYREHLTSLIHHVPCDPKKPRNSTKKLE